MRTVRRLLYRHIVSHVVMVAAGFSALSFFIDFVDEMQRVGKKGYTLLDATWACVLLQGTHVYDLLPIALLIGAIIALARMAQTSEFTILRTGGLSPVRALSLLAGLGIGMAALVVFMGDWVVPWTEHELTIHHAKVSNDKGLDLGHGGAWLRERRQANGSLAHNITVNVGKADGNGHFGFIRIFEFDESGRLLRRISAQHGEIESISGTQGVTGSIWHLRHVTDTVWLRNQDSLSEQAVFDGAQLVTERAHESLDWYSSLTPLVVAASVLPPATMSTAALWRYTEHLANNAQAAQRYEIEFWKKAFYPLVCLVMVGLALPFAYLHARSGGMSLKIFGGIMLGISFILVNHISSHLGLLHHWQPWVAAVSPSLAYLLLSMTAFIWLVRYR